MLEIMHVTEDKRKEDNKRDVLARRLRRHANPSTRKTQNDTHVAYTRARFASDPEFRVTVNTRSRELYARNAALTSIRYMFSD